MTLASLRATPRVCSSCLRSICCILFWVSGLCIDWPDPDHYCVYLPAIIYLNMTSQANELLVTLGWLLVRILPIYILVKILKWFIDPILVYSKQGSDSDMEMYIGGKKLSKSQIGYPYLLREICGSDIKKPLSQGQTI